MILLLCAPPLFVNVGKPDPVRIMETLSFLSSQETWLRIHQGDPDAWKMPSWNGVPRIQKPPLLVWMNLLAWTGLTPETASVELLTERSRALAAGFALLAIASTFWAGMTVGGVRAAVLAALAAGANLLFIRQSRIASYDTHLMGWVTLAVAAGLWSMKHGRLAPRIAGWILALLALAGGCYTKGPLAFALVLAPLAAWIAVQSERRTKDAAALALLGLAAGALLVPWFSAVARATTSARVALDREYLFVLEAFHNPFHYVAVVALMFPWTLWLAAALIHTVADRAARADRAQRFAWLWFVLLFLLFTLSPVKNKRYIVPILPAAGVLIALAWLRFEQLERSGQASKGLAGLRRLHWFTLAAGAVALPLFIVTQPMLLQHGLLKAETVTGLGPLAATVLGFILIVVTVAGAQAHARKQWGSAALYTGLWMIAASTFGFAGYALADHQRFPHRAEAESMAALTGRTHLSFISDFVFPQHQARPSDEFLIFYRGIVPSTDLLGVRGRVDNGEAIVLLTRVSEEREKEIAGMGLVHRFNLCDGRPPDWKVWETAPR